MDVAFMLVLSVLPGLIAERRRHKYPLVVSILGFATAWFSLFLWAVVLVWACIGDSESA